MNSEEKHPLIEIWKNFPRNTKSHFKILEKPPIERIIGEMFTIGEFYYYVLNLSNSQISNHHEGILKIHGFEKYPRHLKEVIDLIHPEDLQFVIKAEQTVVEKLISLGKENQLYIKPSYCFRMRTAKGNYELFHHQAIHTLEDENNILLQSINIHTNIQHITKENPYTVLLSGISPRTDFEVIHLKQETFKEHFVKNLTKRDMEILSFIAKGYSGREISEILILSEHTVRAHRKNILTKTDSRNSKELVKKAFEWGLI